MKKNKKTYKDWLVALNYCVACNIISILPALIIGQTIGYINSPWLQMLAGFFCTFFIVLLSFWISGKYINNHFIIKNAKIIRNWLNGYIIISNLPIVLFIYRASNDRMVLLSLIVNLIATVITAHIFAHKFIRQSSPEELVLIDVVPKVSRNQIIIKSLKAIVKTITTVVLGVFVFLMLPVVLYIILVFRGSFSSGQGLFIAFVWEVLAISLTVKYVKFE